MVIRNLTRRTILCSRIEVARTPFQKARGLMFRSSLKGGMLFVFEKEGKPGIWTFGMFMPIDIAWLSSTRRVVTIKENAQPWRFLGYPRKKAKMVLELPAGTLKKTRTREGDILSIPAPHL